MVDYLYVSTVYLQATLRPKYTEEVIMCVYLSDRQTCGGHVKRSTCARLLSRPESPMRHGRASRFQQSAFCSSAGSPYRIAYAVYGFRPRSARSCVWYIEHSDVRLTVCETRGEVCGVPEYQRRAQMLPSLTSWRMVERALREPTRTAWLRSTSPDCIWSTRPSRVATRTRPTGMPPA